MQNPRYALIAFAGTTAVIGAVVLTTSRPATGQADAPAAKEAGAFLAEMRDKIYLDPSKYFGEAVDAKEAGSAVAVGWSAKRFERYRWLIATLIMNLDEALDHGK